MSFIDQFSKLIGGLQHYRRPEPELSLDTGLAFGGGAGASSAHADAGTDLLEGEVVAILKEFRQVHVRTPEGRVLAITPDTPGVEFSALHRGQRVACTVTRFVPRVLNARVLA
ncbi:hypothetical protein WKW80_24055 [Variovorax humicola]|jgi:hypothetical protein|uniref:Uncharacterized protein n=1 Tax=Variovorax humicola TaxID=1769758 RepID=A0ABU8W693_9BURK